MYTTLNNMPNIQNLDLLSIMELHYVKIVIWLKIYILEGYNYYMQETKIFSTKEKKAWILKVWKVSSGKRITEMLVRYFSQQKKDDTVEKALEIFKNV